MVQAALTPNVLKACSNDELAHLLSAKLLPRLEQCQRSLHHYLAHQRKKFPRFYFVANDALVHVLSNVTEPRAIVAECCECFNNTFSSIEFDELAFKQKGTNAILSIASATETLAFGEPFVIGADEPVHEWLARFEECITATLKQQMTDAFKAGAELSDKQRFDWIFDFAAQIVLTTVETSWTEETELALINVASGSQDAMPAHLEKRQERLLEMVELARQDLTAAQRVTVVSLITADVHARDVVARLVEQEVQSKTDFAWAQQLRSLVTIAYLSTGHPLPAALLPPVNATAETERREASVAISAFYTRCDSIVRPPSVVHSLCGLLLFFFCLLFFF
jgi:dynein heavy chain